MCQIVAMLVLRYDANSGHAWNYRHAANSDNATERANDINIAPCHQFLHELLKHQTLVFQENN